MRRSQTDEIDIEIIVNTIPTYLVAITCLPFSYTYESEVLLPCLFRVSA